MIGVYMPVIVPVVIAAAAHFLYGMANFFRAGLLNMGGSGGSIRGPSISRDHKKNTGEQDQGQSAEEQQPETEMVDRKVPSQEQVNELKNTAAFTAMSVAVGIQQDQRLRQNKENEPQGEPNNPLEESSRQKEADNKKKADAQQESVPPDTPVIKSKFPTHKAAVIDKQDSDSEKPKLNLEDYVTSEDDETFKRLFASRFKDFKRMESSVSKVKENVLHFEGKSGDDKVLFTVDLEINQNEPVGSTAIECRSQNLSYEDQFKMIARQSYQMRVKGAADNDQRPSIELVEISQRPSQKNTSESLCAGAQGNVEVKINCDEKAAIMAYFSAGFDRVVYKGNTFHCDKNREKNLTPSASMKEDSRADIQPGH